MTDARADVLGAALSLRAWLGGWRNRVALDVRLPRARYGSQGGPVPAVAWSALLARFRAKACPPGDWRRLVGELEARSWHRDELLAVAPAAAPAVAQSGTGRGH